MIEQSLLNQAIESGDQVTFYRDGLKFQGTLKPVMSISELPEASSGSYIHFNGTIEGTPVQKNYRIQVNQICNLTFDSVTPQPAES